MKESVIALTEPHSIFDPDVLTLENTFSIGLKSAGVEE
jgi:hypothetical protein